ncbi:hypothetical protein SDC9_115866 [bioreactor metagenome]|uniref:Uncharacterized protein n=1 Tax=bioreactor metagenome TaxID=1076179 RepID=A0A645BU24_9ZZZZ
MAGDDCQLFQTLVDGDGTLLDHQGEQSFAHIACCTALFTNPDDQDKEDKRKGGCDEQQASHGHKMNSNRIAWLKRWVKAWAIIAY